MLGLSCRRWGLLVLVGCVQSSSVTCPDGSLCPDGTACAAVAGETLCVRPDQLADCLGKAELEACGTNVRCYDGVCLPAGCGNGRLDPDEECDDGNTVTGDGCSSDCLSNETCGNGVVDLVKGEQCDDGPISHPQSHDGCASDCTSESPLWTQVPLISEADGAAAAYDASRDRLVLFADIRSTSLTWEWDGSRWMLQTPRISPLPRTRAAMAYDIVRKRVVLFGGDTFDDTWEWDGSNWTLLAPATSPPGRRSHAMVFDPHRKRIVMFGGQDGGGVEFLDDTWEWDGNNWTRIDSPTSPSPRRNAAVAYDPTRDVIVLFGGFVTGNVNDDETWELSGSVWTKRSPATVPPPRSGHSMAFDPRSGRVVLHGGGTPTGTGTDTWLWNGTDWTPHPTAGPAFALAPTATMLREGRVVAFDHGKTFRWDAGWTLFEDSVPTLSPRFAASAAADIAGRRIVIHGGVESTTTPSTLVFTGNWQRFGNAMAGASPRASNAALAYDERNHEFVHFGGATQTGSSNDTWVLASTLWTQKSPPGALPPPRTDPVMVYDAARERVVLFGGLGATRLDDTWLWDGTQWTQVTPTTKPPARLGAMASYDPIRRVVVLFGGAGAVPLADTWEWDGANWTQRNVPGPVARSSGGMAWDAARRRTVLFGGASNSATLNDQWEWDGTTWTLVPTLNTIRPRAYHVVVPSLDGTGVLAFGGTESAVTLNELQWLRWDGGAHDEVCDALDRDGDALVGCDDADCWRVCTPRCAPGATLVTTCGPNVEHCGDGVCNRITESCTTCAADCSCTKRCGDLLCDETPAACPGDCP